MNLYLVIILVALSCEFIMRQLAAFANLGALGPLPEEFKSEDAGDYSTTVSYVSEKTKMALVSRTVNFLLVLVVVLSGVLGVLDETVRGLVEGEFVRALLFVGTLILGQVLLSVPWDLYDTFIIEERYGFNRTTVSTYLGDQLKGLLLTVILGVPVLWLILWVFSMLGSGGWLFLWTVLMVLSLALQYLAPAFILPLFYKFSALDDESLVTEITKLCGEAGFKLSGVYVIDGSRRSAKANAFFTGFGRTKRIALFDTLLEGYSREEIVAVIAHELGHFVCRHTWKLTLVSAISLLIYLYLMAYFLTTEHLSAAFGIGSHSTYAALVGFSILFQPISMLLGIIASAASRKFEYEADALAVDLVGSCDSLISALKKLGKESRVHLTPHRLKVWLDYSHPPLVERIAAMKGTR